MASSDPPRFLLLLPPPPLPATPASLRTAYSDTLVQVLKEVATHSADSPRAAILEIALALPFLMGQENTPRASLFAPTQSIVAGVYGLITRIAAKEAIDVEDQDGVDVRILLVSWSPEHAAGTTSGPAFGPVISLETLARSGRSWQYAFGVESEQGEAFVKAFVEAKGNGEEVSRVQSGSNPPSAPSQTTPSDGPASSSSHPATRHHHIAIGGTFDHIHIGHKLLLTMTVFSVDLPSTPTRRSSTSPVQETHTITIGITGDQLLTNKKHAEVLEPWADRYRGVMHFLDGVLDFAPPSSSGGQRHVSVRDDPGPNGKAMDVHYPNGLVVKCTEIQDPFGPTITEEGISAMVLTAETRAGGRAVNAKRAEKGWAGLELFEVDVLDAHAEEDGGVVREGFESKLSSTAIREKLVRKRQGGGSSSL